MTESSLLPVEKSIHGRPGKGSATFMMLGATAVMLALLFPPFYCVFLAPVALAPFCICVLRRPMNRRHLLFYYLLGVGFFLPNLFWIAPVTIGGWAALALFVALYFPLFAWGLHRLVVQLRVPATFAVPIVWTAVEYIRATCVQGGFPWFLLGNCLTPLPVMIQAADIFGVWGLTFFIALLNGFVVDLLRLPLRQVAAGKSRFSPVIGSLAAVAASALAFVFAYGTFRLGEQTTKAGPRIAVVQENFPQSVKESGTADDDIFERHLALTKTAADATPKPDLIAWPETMLPGFGNIEYLTAPDKAFATFDSPDYWENVRDRTLFYFARLGRVTDTSNVPVLVGVGSLVPDTNFSKSIKQNRTVLVAPKYGPVDYYAKVHLVPFGEYIPFREWPLIGKYMVYLSPYPGIDFSNESGDRWTRFALPVSSYGDPPPPMKSGVHPEAAHPIYTFATPICFEDTMPEPCRRMSSPQYDPSRAGGTESAGRKTDFLVNVSNDGWFAWVELDQHLQACQLRAVENRIAIARAVNTGNSGFIDSNGRVMALVHGAGGSIGSVGTAAMTMPIDSRITFFSKIGDLFPIMCGMVAGVMVGWTLVRPRRSGTAG